MKEYWKPIYIKSSLSRYSISSTGRVRNNDSGKLRKLNVNDRGYVHIVLIDNDGNKHDKRVHRLVAEEYIPVSGIDQDQVNHIDGDRGNNCVDNLDWVSSSENHIHSYDVLGRRSNGEKYSDDSIHRVCVMLERGDRIKDIEKETGVSRKAQYDLMKGNTRQSITVQYNLPKVRNRER
jgi:hypothetical protein